MKIKKSFALVLLLACVFDASSQTGAPQQAASNAPAARHHLMPVPASVQFGAGRLAVTKSFTVAATGFVGERLREGVERAMRRLEGRTVMEFASGFARDAGAATLVIDCKRQGRAVPSVEEDESYTLDVTDRQAQLRAPTDVGALRGLETFLQLLEGGREGFYIPVVTINDKPRFRWRGLLIDIGRHYEPPEVLKRNLDAMAAVKMNVFHWHLTEDQGFRIESKKFPRLAAMGSDGNYYTQEQARDIINYAAERGIRVVPEFDMPGHATSWLVGHPELGSAPGPYTIERGAGIFNPSLDPTREETYKFLDVFLGEMAALFPDAYMHIGGDENTGKQWRENPKIQAFMKEKGIKDNHGLQTYFNQRLLKILQKHGKRMMGWDEIFQPDLPKDVVIHSWRGQKALAEAARRGYEGILSNGYYIDLIFPTSDHYLNDPVPEGSTLTPEEAARVLGGEATMWSEWVNADTIDSRIWPRTAAIAERLWSPREVRDVDDMYRRLAVISVQLEELGLTHEKNQAMMLRRLAGGSYPPALETLASFVEPVKEYRRYDQRPQTMLSPLTGLVDAARPDSTAARGFTRRVNLLLSDAPRFALHFSTLRDTLTSWRDAGPVLETLIDRSPALAEARPLARDMASAGEIGLEALSYIQQGVAPTDEWRDARLAALAEIEKPKAALELPFIGALRELVHAAHEQPSLRQTTPAEWRAHIKSLAAPPAKGNEQ
ncbi:MAG TPA: family 20 glycosylhydrolase [Pyrinomonadaceae bacterium]|jgi:hexosaminidase|nr:family 20 glycosylhydrolase [Pyrinomonadaceae bacterium]